MNLIEALADKEYDGRSIVLGMTPDGKPFALYGLTGRSPSSQAREIVENGDRLGFRTEPTDKEVISQGNVGLLVYDCLLIDKPSGIVAVSNGKQTRSLVDAIDTLLDEQKDYATLDLLAEAASVAGDGEIDLSTYEPDAPNFTPRISGVVDVTLGEASLSILRKSPSSENCEKQFIGFDLEPGRAKYIATYTGKNVPSGTPIPSYNSMPLDIEINETTANELAKSYWDAQGPKDNPSFINPGVDMRVSVLAVVCEGKDYASAIINRHD